MTPTRTARTHPGEDPMPDTDVRPFVREVHVPMAPSVIDPQHGPMVNARLIIRGTHHCQGRPEACADECLLIIGVVLVDPDAGPGVEQPYTGGWVEPDNVHEIIDALWAAATTPTPDEVAAR